MNSFTHHVIRHGTVKVRRHGRNLRISIDAEGMSRITIEIEDGQLIVLEDAALNTGDPTRITLSTMEGNPL